MRGPQARCAGRSCRHRRARRLCHRVGTTAGQRDRRAAWKSSDVRRARGLPSLCNKGVAVYGRRPGTLALARSPRRRPYIRSSKPKRYGTPSSRLLHLSPMMRSARSALRSSTGMRCSPMLRSRNIGAATKSEPDVAGRRAGLDARLPAAAPAEEPASLAYTHQSPNGEQC